jgi:hypothetical protein
MLAKLTATGLKFFALSRVSRMPNGIAMTTTITVAVNVNTM